MLEVESDLYGARAVSGNKGRFLEVPQVLDKIALPNAANMGQFALLVLGT